MSGLSTRWRAALVVVASVLALHALVLGVVPLRAGPAWPGDARAVLQVRQIVVESRPTIEIAEAAASPQAPAATPPPSPAPATARRTTSPSPAPSPEPRPAATVAEVSQAPEAQASASPGIDGAPAIDADGQPLPTFATRLPPGTVLRFELRRGGLSGEAEMVWRPRPDGYRLTMQGTAFGLPVLGWLSEGGFDIHGLAPERFVDRRRARDVRAANFERSSGRIRYSGPPVEYPLWPGSQDRLSWLVQLPAIVAAAPEAFAPGARIPIFVTGARGDADAWVFVVEALEAVEVAGGRMEHALRLSREPRRRFDTRVDIWLDPARHYLPLRLQLTAAHSGESSQFILQEMVFP